MNIENKIKSNVDLSDFSTFRISGVAKFFVEIEAKEELQEAFRWAAKLKLKVFIFSGGSNILVGGTSINGLVVKIANKNIKVLGDRIECGAGVALSSAVINAKNSSLSGLEWAIGIPGSVGGAVRGNAGAYGGSIQDSIETVEVYNKEKEEFQNFSKNDCDFLYRSSIFKTRDDLIVWSIGLRLVEGDREEIGDLSLDYLNKREGKQPKLPSAGCVFKNLMYEDVKAVNSKLAEEADKEGVVKGGKIGVGWVIGKLNIKGKSMGGAKISLEHANFIVNTGLAKPDDVVMLISYIKQQVRDEFNIQLEEEVEYFGI